MKWPPSLRSPHASLHRDELGWRKPNCRKDKIGGGADFVGNSSKVACHFQELSQEKKLVLSIQGFGRERLFANWILPRCELNYKTIETKYPIIDIAAIGGRAAIGRLVFWVIKR